MKKNDNIEIQVDDDYVRVIDREKLRSVEYRGMIPGGIACSTYAEEIIAARAERRKK